MNHQTYRIALGGMLTALSIVILLLGAILGIGIYAAPMLAGLCLLPIGREMGRKYHTLMWLAVSLLSFILISDVEQNLMYLCLFGCYPIVRPWFQRLKKPMRLVIKLAYFNTIILAVETLALLVLAPEALGPAMIAALLILGNLTFLCYDFVFPVFDMMLARYLQRFLKRKR